MEQEEAKLARPCCRGPLFSSAGADPPDFFMDRTKLLEMSKTTYPCGATVLINPPLIRSRRESKVTYALRPPIFFLPSLLRDTLALVTYSCQPKPRPRVLSRRIKFVITTILHDHDG